MLRAIGSKMSVFKLGLVQLAVSGNKADNLQRATSLVKKASENGAHLVSLPECFNSPYGIDYFDQYAEEIPSGESCSALSKMAKDSSVYLIGGSIPERDGGALYNTCTIWSPGGSLLAKHRKVHLFDINVPGKMVFQESKVLSPGSELTIVETDLCKIGIGICYDLRFPEMSVIYREAGCGLLVFPGAFNMTTGPAHWRILQQGRAVDNQCYVAGCSPARDEKANYVAWGHSTIVSPWGEILAEADEKETILYADIDLEYIKKCRESIPLGKQRRTDLYSLPANKTPLNLSENHCCN